MEKGPSAFAEYWTNEYSECDHFDRHGEKLGYYNITEYSQGAKTFAKSNERGIKNFKAENGAIYRFNPKTNEFVIISKNGEIVTYYYLEGGWKTFENYRIDENGVEFY